MKQILRILLGPFLGFGFSSKPAVADKKQLARCFEKIKKENPLPQMQEGMRVLVVDPLYPAHRETMGRFTVGTVSYIHPDRPEVMVEMWNPRSRISYIPNDPIASDPKYQQFQDRPFFAMSSRPNSEAASK